MNFIFKKIILFVLFSVLAGEIQAQNTKLKMIAKPKGDTIMLRWYPPTWEALLFAKKYGYVLEKTTYERNGEVLPKSQRTVVKKAMQVLKQNQWAALKSKTKYAEVIEKTLFEIDVEAFKSQNKDNPMALLSTQNQDELLLILTLLPADLSAEVARGLALRFDDTEIKKNERYLYKVYLDLPKSLNIKPDTAKIALGKQDFLPEIPPQGLQINYQDSTTHLTWSVLPQGQYAAYTVERSTDNQQFTPITSAPLIHTVSEGQDSTMIFYDDKLTKLNQFYYYRVRGINPFSELSVPSITESIFAYTSAFPFPELLKFSFKDNGVLLEWSLADSLNNYIKGFQVVKTTNPEATFLPVSEVLPTTARSFIDTTMQASNYYQLLTLDKGNNYKKSFTLLVQPIDSIPPSPPVKLIGKANKKGVVEIAWQKPPENDVAGYRLYFANTKKGNFVLKTDSVFVDTKATDTLSLRLLSKNVYYYLVALDKRYNASVSSDTLEVKRPDVLPPIPPLLKNFHVSDSTVVLQWLNSPSEDLSKTEVFRQILPDTTLKLIHSFQGVSDTLFTDHSLADTLKKLTLRYHIIATDLDSNKTISSDCNIILEKPAPKFRIAIKNIKTEIDSTAKQFTIKWQYAPPAEKFMVYRKAGFERMSYYKLLPYNQPFIVEKNIAEDVPYTYLLIAVFKDGKQSRISQPIDLIIKKPKE